MYESLRDCCDNFNLFILAFDDTCWRTLAGLDLPSVTVISLREFEDERLAHVKHARSEVEYCYTCTPSLVRYVIEEYQQDVCTYVDADIYFYSSPQILLDELAGSSVMITEHRYTAQIDRTKKFGRYCVQFNSFRHDEAGMEALKWWREACIDWCFLKVERNRYADQKYLDDWPTRFDGVHVLQHAGGGVAPWNVQQYDVFESDGKLCCRHKQTGQEFELIFYHFQQLTFNTGGKVDLGIYPLSADVIELLYKPYIRHLYHVRAELHKRDPSLEPQTSSYARRDLRMPHIYLYRKLTGTYNVLNESDFLAG